MFPYYKKYVWITVGGAVAVAVVSSTVWAFATGTVMASTVVGLITQVVLFFGTLFALQAYFSRKATAETDALVSLYDDKCDPQSFVRMSEELAHAIRAPYGDSGSWFGSLYGQALIDLGRHEDVRRIENGMRRSVEAERKPRGKAAVMVNFMPFALKVYDSPQALAFIDEALGYLESENDMMSLSRKSYAEAQREALIARIEGRTAVLLDTYDAVHASEISPMRARVEAAWEAAKICYSNDDLRDRERGYLRFIVDNGNRLALVGAARDRLRALDGAQDQ